MNKRVLDKLRGNPIRSVLTKASSIGVRIKYAGEAMPETSGQMAQTGAAQQSKYPFYSFDFNNYDRNNYGIMGGIAGAALGGAGGGAFGGALGALGGGALMYYAPQIQQYLQDYFNSTGSFAPATAAGAPAPAAGAPTAPAPAGGGAPAPAPAPAPAGAPAGAASKFTPEQEERARQFGAKVRSQVGNWWSNLGRKPAPAGGAPATTTVTAPTPTPTIDRAFAERALNTVRGTVGAMPAAVSSVTGAIPGAVRSLVTGAPGAFRNLANGGPIRVMRQIGENAASGSPLHARTGDAFDGFPHRQ